MRTILLVSALCMTVIIHAQNVGIGVTAPVYKLDVRNGSINTDSIYRQNGVHILSSKGTGNLYVGENNAYENTTGSFNTALGFGALNNNGAGTHNTSVGYQSNVSSGNLVNATAIGAYSQVSISNAMVLGSIAGTNGATTSTRVGIGLSNPATALDVSSTSASVGRFSGPDQMYIVFNEAGNYRGYMGSFAGAAPDMDFGTGSGNSTGNVHLTLTGNPALTVESSGNVNIRGGEFNRSSVTGTANLVPIAYGNVMSNGGINTNGSTGNFSVNQTATGSYSITITGETYNLGNYCTTVTASGTVPILVITSSGGGALLVRTYNLSGALTDASFHFIIYQP